MSEDMRERWAALVESGRARWMPGMLTEAGYRVLSDDGDTSERVLTRGGYESHERRGTLDEYDVPDLTDPATSGCLLDQVRQAWGDPRGACIPMEWANTREPGWGYVTGWGGGVGPFSPTEGEALLAALEARP